MSKEQVLEQALQLTLEERAELARDLLFSLEEPTPDENLKLWIEVVAKRIEDIDGGKVQPIPGEEARRRVQERLSGALQ